MGRTTPYDTVVSFVKATEQRDFTRAAEYLNSRQSLARREELARTLIRVMNRGLALNVNSLSRQPGGDPADGLAENRDLVGSVVGGNSSLDIFLDRIQLRNNPPLWLFSADTLLSLSDFEEEEMEIPWIERWMPAWLLETKLWGVALYRYISIPVGLLAMLGIAWGAGWILVCVYGRVFRSAIRNNYLPSGTGIVAPLRLFLFASLISLGEKFGATLMTRLFWGHVAAILMVTALTWLILRAIDFASQSIVAHLSRIRSQHQIAAVKLLRGSAKSLIVIIAGLTILKIQGVELTAAVAGLGIGGLALAFAAQKTIENLFGTVTLLTDQPVRVGDFCRLGDTLGTIEAIGMRSTRIRTLERTLVSVPNGQIASTIVENFAARDKMWFSHTLGLRYETSADQLRYVLATIRAMLYAHPKVESESARIRFVKFGESSLNLEIFAYVFAPDFATYLESQEDLLLRVMDIVETSGTGMAFPSQTTYLAKDTGLNQEKRNAAIAQVEEWRHSQALPFPNHSTETIKKIRGSIDYPAPESAVRERQQTK